MLSVLSMLMLRNIRSDISLLRETLSSVRLLMNFLSVPLLIR